MSATNRGREREANDNYPTPEWLTEAILLELGDYWGGPLLEPAAGEGAIVRILKRAFPTAQTDAGDIVSGQDFLTYPWPRNHYKLIITNPPYSLAESFARRALELIRPDGAVVLLLRLSFLASQQRAAWMRRTHPSVFVTPRRPCFVRGKSDNCEYGWFVWHNVPAAIRWLETERDDAT